MRSFAFAAIVAAATAIDTSRFAQWIAQHGKAYATEHEFKERLMNWMANDAAIETLNAMNTTATFAHNAFSDLSRAEYKAMLTLRPNTDNNEVAKYTYLPTSNNASVDWRTKGAVTPVKDQGQCGSCWSFSTTGAMEGAHFLATGELVSLAEQQFVDCSTANYGCNGGWQYKAFEYAEQNPIMLESDYKYTAQDGTCKAGAGVVSVKSFATVPNNDVAQLKAALDKQPVSVSLDAATHAFGYYSGGILTKGCGFSIDHAVLAVGYGSENGQEYWIVKNSWGTSWGEDGYIRIGIEDGKGVCGIQSDDNAYPTTN